ncbi:MAG: N-acetylmuramoyl-L-alanine amidase [Gemmatimonadota bacterium]
MRSHVVIRSTDVYAALVGLFVALLLPLGALAQGGMPLVVIDAGHGGVDPGARGPSGTLEKTVALQVARELEALLLASGDVEVRLTRDSDTLVPLTERTSMANQWRQAHGEGRPALFLSIHANAHDSRSVRGFETYFLSEANTEDARRVATFENSAQRFEDSGPSGDPLSFILNDLRQNLYLHESSAGAELFQKRLSGVHPGPDRGVKQASFVVLDGAFMPAVLVELGFITNPEDEAMLRTRGEQTRLARQLESAVHDFFRRPSVASIGANP